MAKAFLSSSLTTALTSGHFHNLFGGSVTGTNETRMKIQATEACTFSNLGINITAGGSGTNTFRFRKNTADGNQVVAQAGTGKSSDLTNTDTLAATDLFSLSYVDTGTNSTVAWIKGNVEFSSGYGCYLGSSNPTPRVFDVASSTRFIPIGGALGIDGVATEADVALKCRGYTSCTAIQVFVDTNARTNNSVFKNRINGADGTASCTVAAGLTGLFVSSAVSDAISDGQTVGVSVTLLTGVEDIALTAVAITLKSSSTKQDVLTASSLGQTRTGSAVADYYSLGGIIHSTTPPEANARIPVGFSGTASNLRCYLSANAYTTNATLKLFKNGSAVLTTTLTAAGGAGWYENTADSVTFTATDELSYEIVGGTANSIVVCMIAVTLMPTTNSRGINLRQAVKRASTY